MTSLVTITKLILGHHFVARRPALLGYGKDWVAQCQDKVTEWDFGS